MPTALLTLSILLSAAALLTLLLRKPADATPALREESRLARAELREALADFKGEMSASLKAFGDGQRQSFFNKQRKRVGEILVDEVWEQLYGRVESYPVIGNKKKPEMMNRFGEENTRGRVERKKRLDRRFCVIGKTGLANIQLGSRRR